MKEKESGLERHTHTQKDRSKVCVCFRISQTRKREQLMRERREREGGAKSWKRETLWAYHRAIEETWIERPPRKDIRENTTNTGSVKTVCARVCLCFLLPKCVRVCLCVSERERKRERERETKEMCYVRYCNRNILCMITGTTRETRKRTPLPEGKTNKKKNLNTILRTNNDLFNKNFLINCGSHKRGLKIIVWCVCVCV